MNKISPVQKILFILLLIFVITFGNSLISQEMTPTIQRVDLSKLPEIQCYFTVTDSSGRSVLGLTKEELEILVDGVPQQMLNLQSALDNAEYLAVALLFDRSGSMRGTLDQVKMATGDFIRRMSRDDLLAVISFDDKVRLDSTFTKDRTLTENAVKSIQMGRNTALYDAIHTAFALLEDVTTRRQAIVIFSDGKDTRSQQNRSDILAEAKARGIPLFFIGLGSEVDSQNLSEMGSETGGHLFKAVRPDDFLLLYQTIADQLENQYLVFFTMDFGEDEKWHDLRIQFKDAGEDKNTATRKFIASRGPGITRETVAGFQSDIEQRKILQSVLVGALLGILFGVILILMTKLLNREIRLFSPLVTGILLLSMFIGAVFGAAVSMF